MVKVVRDRDKQSKQNIFCCTLKTEFFFNNNIDFIFFTIPKRPLKPAVSTAILGGLPKLTQYNSVDHSF